tara:strand:+ start:84 stop:323 length:240 start_codon:yes stop_codon:yes gene_type:complete
MIGARPKVGNPVSADYAFSDIKTQRRWLLDFANAVNSQRGIDEPKIDGTALVNKMLKRVSRYYGMQTKYNSDGSLKEGY